MLNRDSPGGLPSVADDGSTNWMHPEDNQPSIIVVERSFARLCRNRRLAKDFETRVHNTQAYLQLAMNKLLTRRLATN